MHTLQRCLFLIVLLAVLFGEHAAYAQRSPVPEPPNRTYRGPVAGVTVGALLGTALAGTTCYGLLVTAADSGSGSFAPYSIACGAIGTLTIAGAAYAGGSLSGGHGNFGFSVLGAAIPALIATAGLIPTAFEGEDESGVLMVSGVLLFLVGTPLGAVLGYTMSDVLPESDVRISPSISRTDRRDLVFGISGVF